MSKVYIVNCRWDYEGSDNKAVVATKEEADLLAAKYSDSNHFSFDAVNVEEWEIGEVTDKRWDKP